MTLRMSVGIAAAALVPASVLAQDIEMMAQRAPRPLPASYYARVQAQPDFFQLRRGWIAKARRAAEDDEALTGALPLVVINALFAGSNQPHVSSQDIQQAVFDGPSAGGTVSAFYEEGSNGRFTISGQAVEWVQTSLTMEEVVAESFGLGQDSRVGDYLLEALGAADGTVDFGLFDSDGPDGVPNSGDDDGFVDAVAFQFLEIAASCGGPAIWPHRSRVSGWTDGEAYETNDEQPSGDPILVNDYIIQSAVTCDGTAVQTVNTIAHELGHVLGLPDLYDRRIGIQPEQRRWVVGCWGLMAAGAWGCLTVDRSAVRHPTHLSAWSKRELGWVSETLVPPSVRNQEYVLGPVLSSEEIIHVPLSDAEHLLIEYRQLVGFDDLLPAAGVLVYHIDSKRATQIPNCLSCDDPYLVALVEADGNRTLTRNTLQGGNRGEPGDAFARLTPQRLSHSTPSTTRLNSGEPSGVTFYSIAIEDGVARLRLSTSAVETTQLLAPFLLTGELTPTPEDLVYLDEVGNNNGRFDVGDLRAYLNR